MIGLTPDQQAHLIGIAATSIILLSGLTLVWFKRQYTLRGILKRLRYHL